MPALSAFNFITAAKPQMRLVPSGGNNGDPEYD